MLKATESTGTGSGHKERLRSSDSNTCGQEAREIIVNGSGHNRRPNVNSVTIGPRCVTTAAIGTVRTDTTGAAGTIRPTIAGPSCLDRL